MQPTTYVLGFQLIAGLVATAPLLGPMGFHPAHETIDQPGKGWRFFYRTMALLMCNLVSWLTTAVILGFTGEHFDMGAVDDWVNGWPPLLQALHMLLMPLPLLPFVYLGYAKFVRWLSARILRQ